MGVEVFGGGASDQVEGVVVEDQAGVGCQEERGMCLSASVCKNNISTGRDIWSGSMVGLTSILADPTTRCLFLLGLLRNWQKWLGS